MRWVEIEAEVRVRDDLPHLPPDGRRGRQVVTTRPFVVGEDHWAVLDGDLYAVIARKLHERRPDLLKLTEVRLDRLVLVSANEGAGDGHVQHLGSDDDSPQMVAHHVSMGRILVEGIGVVGE